MKPTFRVNQSGLADALGITTRRVRELIADGILPEAVNGRWDVEDCGERYSLFKAGPNDPIWREYEVEVVAKARLAETLHRAVMKPSAKPQQVGPAIEAAEDACEAVKFMMAARKGLPPELAHAWLTNTRAGMVGEIWVRGLELVAKHYGATVGEIEASLRAAE